ncbi:MAG: hypothetical protein E7620_05020, partial [Ruminococcaceae bacterium]|nr:hypothetical protein [Oscillospiraceae bacterium]
MKYVTERSALTLSVGELCAEATAQPHLDLRRGSASPDRLKKGREAHRLLQKRADQGYEAEVSLTNTTLCNGVCYEVSGRADGVLRSGGTVLVEEIKSVGANGFERGPDSYHEAQAMCYAHFLCERDRLHEIGVQLTLCRLEDGKTKSFRRTVSAEEARAFYLRLLSQISYRAKYLMELELERRPSAEAGRFPYRGVREGQDIMLKECYRGIKSRKKLFIQAPTGTGKTISSLYPAVRAFGKSYCDKIFYLTAKASTRREAYNAAARIFESGSRVRTVVLTSREQLCSNQAAREDPAGISRHCNPESCPRAVGFHSKCKNALVWLLDRQNGYPRATVESVSEQFGICPYEFQLALSELCDIVICDYNYVFDPMVYLRRYFSEDVANGNRYVFLIDEAHNLGDRACEMYSAALRLSDVQRVYGMLLSLGDEALPERMRPLEHLIVTLRGYRRLCRDNLFRDESGVEHGYYLNQNQMLDLNELLLSCRGCLEKWLRGQRSRAEETEALRFTATLKKFLTVAELYGQGFLTFIEVNGEEITVEQICR